MQGAKSLLASANYPKMGMQGSVQKSRILKRNNENATDGVLVRICDGLFIGDMEGFDK
jgi:hypothetical protein